MSEPGPTQPCVTVAELMVAPPTALRPDAALRSAVEALADAHLVALPVTDETGRLVGLLDEEDLLVLAEDPHLVEQEAALSRFWPLGGGRRAAEHLRLIHARQVSEVMRHHPPVIHPSARCERAAEVMADHHAGVLAVVDDDGRLVGVLTRRALLGAWWAGRLC
ncbi:MAG: CBS domain-containing protein [Actinomycetota bacterium]|nr:CBS domain-containing protein [Actinomycetota bacterium]